MAKANSNTASVQTNDQTQTAATTVAETPKYDVAALLGEHKTRSAVIRYLSGQGHDVKGIHKILVAAGWKSEKSGEPIRYQHVRNVLKQQPKRASTTASTPVQAPTPAQ